MLRLTLVATAIISPAVTQASRPEVRFEAGQEVARIDTARGVARLLRQASSVAVGTLIEKNNPGPCDVWYRLDRTIKGERPAQPVRCFYCRGGKPMSGAPPNPDRQIGTVDYLYSSDGEMFCPIGPALEHFEPYSLQAQADFVEASLAIGAAKGAANRAAVAGELLRSPSLWRRAVAIGSIDGAPTSFEPAILIPDLPANANRGEREALIRIVGGWLDRRNGDEKILTPLFENLAREEIKDCGRGEERRCGPRMLDDHTRSRIQEADRVSPLR